MNRFVLLLALCALLSAFGCSAYVPPPEGDSGPETGEETPSVDEWVRPEPYLERIDMIDPAGGCNSDPYPGERLLCLKRRADECIEAVEATAVDCEQVPEILTNDPICAGFCVPESEVPRHLWPENR